MSTTNIFGLTRDTVIICGLAFLSTNSLLPAERVWMQENSEKNRNEYNKQYLEFVGNIQKALSLESEEKAYHLIRCFYRGEIEDREVYDKLELTILKHPRPSSPDADIEELTYFINSRLIKTDFPKAEFKETFGIEYKDKWTVEHTKAIAEIAPQIEEFFLKEINGGTVPEATEGKTD
jgi:hypothetical protein